MSESFPTGETTEEKVEEQPENVAEKKPMNLDLLVVLGKNWRKYPEKPKNQKSSNKDTAEQLSEPTPEKIHLSIESKMSALATLMALKEGMVKKVIISTGKTAGPDFPGEAEAMRDYILARNPELADMITLEETSIDTQGNAEEVARMLEEAKETYEHIGLLSVDFHLERSKKVFAEHGIQTTPISAESLLRDRSERHQRFVAEFEQSNRVKIEKVKEWLLTRLLAIDPKGRMLRQVTKQIRKGK